MALATPFDTILPFIFYNQCYLPPMATFTFKNCQWLTLIQKLSWFLLVKQRIDMNCTLMAQAQVEIHRFVLILRNLI